MMTPPGTAESHWIDSSEETSYPPLVEAAGVDVAVVGGGIAGICAAWELTRMGRSVAVLEADRVATGVSGYTTAKLSSLHTLIYAPLRDSHGADRARLYAQSQQDAVEHVAHTASELGIDCDLERVPAFTYVESLDQIDRLRAEVEAATGAGLPASFVTETSLPFRVAGDQAQFHPRRYLLALAWEMIRRGARVHERTRVVALHEGEPCTLTTDAGVTVTARDVVVATHYPVFDRALLFARLKPHRELAVAAVIPSDRDPRGMYITPEQNVRSVRTAPYHDGRRLLIVTGETFAPGTGEVAERFERLAAWTREQFGVSEFAYRWAAQDNDTTDGVPYVGHLHAGAKHVYVATGYGGWGMSNGVMSGRLLASLITGGELPWAKLYDPRRLHPMREAAPLLKLQATVAKHFVGDRLRPSHVDSADEILGGSGSVARIGGERCAIYRDETGAVHALSARCTHRGCLVHFNDAERASECPCHGSRFAIDGSVLQGPANEPLERREVDAPPS
jgi:glycine/D-amino acid oxidase-like deaminating enzyme/nitrite reductase/ring-hydroxylating ferredoxin subunit